jgi:hypothetical protein
MSLIVPSASGKWSLFKNLIIKALRSSAAKGHVAFLSLSLISPNHHEEDTTSDKRCVSWQMAAISSHRLDTMAGLEMWSHEHIACCRSSCSCPSPLEPLTIPNYRGHDQNLWPNWIQHNICCTQPVHHARLNTQTRPEDLVGYAWHYCLSILHRRPGIRQPGKTSP